LKCATLPTPLHKLEALSGRLCTEVFVKRDDLTGSAMGGNKIRNAEFLLGDALQQQADVILTIGALQSNHALAIATGSRRLGKECHLFLSGELKGEPSANLLLNQLAGAHIHMVSSPSDRHTAMMKYAADLSAKGQKPYPIPLGGSNDIGSQGYALAFLELQNQLNKLPHKPTTLIFASSSGGTYAGLLIGKALTGSPVKLVGIKVDLDPKPQEVICSIANALAGRLGISREFEPNDVRLESGHVGEGYGIPTKEALVVLKEVWQSEGILLDPIYTAKAMAGLIDLSIRDEFANERLIFLHTGGSTATFSFSPSVFTSGLDAQD